MSQKVRITRKSTEDLDSEDFKTPPNSENGVGDQKEAKKASSAQKEIKKASSEPKEIKKSSDHKEVKKPSDQKEVKKSSDQKEVKKSADQKEQKKEQKRASSEQKDLKGQKAQDQKDAKQTSKSVESKEHNETNGKELTNGEPDKIVTRSSTPQRKKKAEEKVAIIETIQEESANETKGKNDEEEQNKVNGQDSSSDTELNTSTGTDKMDPLVLPMDEPDPELEFEEYSDLSESGKSGKVSPIINRCITRRSQSRSIPTPKSPKDDQESDKISQQTDSGSSTPSKMMTRRRNKKATSDTDDDSMASDSLSTRAEVGSDSTRLDFSNQDSGILDDNSFLSANKDRSVGETLRYLSPRRTIRLIDNDYRKQVLRGNLEKGAYFSYSNSESVTIGLKRKNRSISPVEVKRYKVEHPGLFTRLTSPLLSFRNKFRGDVPTSTPKLTGYINTDNYENDNVSKIGSYGEEDKLNEKKWCSIM